MMLLMSMILGLRTVADRQKTRARAIAGVQHLSNALTEYHIRYAEYPEPIPVPGRTENGINIATNAFRSLLPQVFLTDQEEAYAVDPYRAAYVYERDPERRDFTLYSMGRLNKGRPGDENDDIYPGR
jgi:hypothetical protein